jgi:predicted ATP-dependent serine protease
VNKSRETLWVCQACGKEAPTREGLPDCPTWRVEVYADTVKRDTAGVIVEASAVLDPTAAHS